MLVPAARLVQAELAFKRIEQLSCEDSCLRATSRLNGWLNGR